ncbi:MAG: nucleotidyltransferase domain-containing protein [Betaproteobacteria bacterium]|nr:nucleotidyltransferase domain-containing protein [Betaproteobacteria bacterium]
MKWRAPSQKLTLNKKELSLVRAIVRHYAPRHRVHAFGSRVLADTEALVKQHADLDLIFDGPELTLEERFALREAFSDSDLPMRVDFIEAADVPKTWAIRTSPV